MLPLSSCITTMAGVQHYHLLEHVTEFIALKERVSLVEFNRFGVLG